VVIRGTGGFIGIGLFAGQGVLDKGGVNTVHNFTFDPGVSSLGSFFQNHSPV
jgi:hypothetical protein